MTSSSSNTSWRDADRGSRDECSSQWWRRGAFPSRAGTTAMLLAGALCVSLAVGIPASAKASVVTFGSPLRVPATLNTAEHLNYKGTDTNVPPSSEAPSGVVHTYHYGADAALWNTSVAGGQASAPATGQARKIMLEGCAVPASDGAPALTQIHFQVLSPTPGGGVRVSLSSGAFDLPVCGRGGASGSTVTTYEPVNLCVSQGDYVAFNEEGGFVEHSYQSGVPYKVIGAVSGSAFDSFIRGGGTNNGDSFSPLDASAMDGFAVNRSAELMMQVSLGTGADATHICAGGTAGLAPALPPIRVSPQTDGVNHQRIVAIAVYCRLTPECKGVATLTLPGKRAPVGQVGFNLLPNKTSHMPIRLAASLMGQIRKHHGVMTTFTALINGKTISQTVGVRIL
jgi:hypothetical protein